MKIFGENALNIIMYVYFFIYVQKFIYTEYIIGTKYILFAIT